MKPQLPNLLTETGILIQLPDFNSEELIAAVEVLIQQGVSCFSINPETTSFSTLKNVFASRACFGLHNISSACLIEKDTPAKSAQSLENSESAANTELFFPNGSTFDSSHLSKISEAGFVWLNGWDRNLVTGLHAAGLPVFLSALTPTEVSNCSMLGADCVIVCPAEVLGNTYCQWLPKLVADVPFAPAGGLTAYSGGRWISNGAKFICVDSSFVAEKLDALAQLRSAIAEFVSTVNRNFPSGLSAT